MPIQLRPYQQELVDLCLTELRKGNRKPLLVLPTGGGKTAIASELVRRSHAKGRSSIFICHRQELIKQTDKTYRKNGIEPAIIMGGVNPNYDNPMQVASVNTLVRRLDLYKEPDIVFWDECHHIASSTWATIADRYKSAVHIGLTATPCRLDGKPLNTAFDCMCEVINTKQLINAGYLSQFLYYAPSVINTDELTMSSNGDYTKESLANASFSAKIVGDNIAQYSKLAYGKRNIVFAINRMHGQDITRRYNEAGIKAEFLDGETNKSKRQKVLEQFSDGEVKVLVNCELFGEGFDLPAVEVVSLLRPTASTSLYLQQVGRGLRPCPEIGKTKAIILDHVNNWQKHGMPDDEREWTLSSGLKKKRGASSSIAIRRCPVCFFAHSPSLTCPNCGYKYVADGKVIKEIAGELVLLGSEQARQAEKKEVIIADSLVELIRIETDRGYKKFWAERTWQAKTGENLWATMDGLEKIANARGYDRGWAWIQWNRIRKGSYKW